MTGAAGKPKLHAPMPSMQGPDADGCYRPVALAEHVMRFGRPAAFTLSTDGIIALALGVDALADRLAEVASAASELRDIEEFLAGRAEGDLLSVCLDRIERAVFGGEPTEEAQGQ